MILSKVVTLNYNHFVTKFCPNMNQNVRALGITSITKLGNSGVYCLVRTT